jgi:hypothetical protein
MTQASTEPLPRDRSFGLTFTAVFALVGAWMAWKGRSYFAVPLCASGFFLLASVAFPRVLHPLNVAWTT